jgi:glycosyltransferase involved in cell wall biosynthesis
MKASIIITNYNKSLHLKKCIRSCIEQTYRNVEIILFDDCSNDSSNKIYNKFKKKIKIIENKKKKFISPSQNQIYGIYQSFLISKGDVIFLLDGDDYFKKNKICKIIKYFKENNIKFIQDTPNTELIKIKKKKYLSFSKNYFRLWPKFYNTSTICIKKDLLKKFFNFIKINEYFYLEIDAQLSIYSYYANYYKKINYCGTVYTKINDGIFSITKKFSSNWWKKRNEAFNFVNKIIKFNIFKINLNLDFATTKLINLFLK